MKMLLKLKRKHPNNAMIFGDHVILPHATKFDISKSELKLLKTTGPNHWIEIVKEKKAKKPKLDKKKDAFAEKLNSEIKKIKG